MKIIDSILTDAASIAAIRKDIHAHPELCFKEERTADVVAKQLTDWGIPIHRGMGTTGVIGIVHGRDGGKCGRGVGLRADIDALPDLGDKVCMVSQSTMFTDEFERLAALLKARFPGALIFDTICGATKDRQADILELQKQGCQAIVVIGGRHSANTVKLAKLVEIQGLPCFHVETAAELDFAALARFGVVGVTAGASTPAFLIDEVCVRLEKAA